MFDLSLNNRWLVGTVSGLTAVGLGYYLYKNYSNFLFCGKHCVGGNCENGVCKAPSSENEKND